MDYRKTAAEISEAIGGAENIISAAHCATRLRLVIADNGKVQKSTLENVEGVKGVFEASGQLQIILGTGVVNKVFEHFTEINHISAASKEDVKQAAVSKQNVFMRAVKTLGDVFVPIIPAIVASGLLMGLLEGLCNAFPAMAASSTYTIIHLFSNAAFVYLPILIAISAAKVFGGNQFLGAVIGMIMIHPDLINAWSVATADSIPTASVLGLYDINLVGYQGHVIPVVIAVWFMSALEKKLHKIVPEIIDLFVTPLVTVLVTGYLTLAVFGPIFSTLETWVLNGMEYLITIPFGIGAFFCGAVYAPTVVAGIHHMYNALEAGLLSANGVNTWMPIATAANVAQGAAALALALKTKNTKTKAMALPASLSAFLGITEPAIFGVNLRFMKPFIAGCIGGAFGALFASVMHIGATAYGITGVFGFLITTQYALPYLLTMLIAGGIAFVISWILYQDPAESDSHVSNVTDSDTSKRSDSLAVSSDDSLVYAPVSGTQISLSDVADPTFSSGVLGQGVAIEPSNGMIYAPFDGTVSMLYETHHAIGVTSNSGIELLIHVGINTVALNGEGFTSLVANDSVIQKGQPLLKFDMQKIADKNYPLTTMVIVTNSEDCNDIQIMENGTVANSSSVMRVTI